jgi:signal transduction histidine kinase
MSLRSSLILAFAGMIVFSLVIAGLALTFLLRGYQDGLTETRMRDLSRPLFFRIANAGRESPRGISPARLAEALYAQAGDLPVVGMVVDGDGMVRLDTSPEQPFIGHHLSLQAPATGPGDPEGMVSGIFRAPDGRRYVYASSRLTVRAEEESRVFNLVLATPSADITGGIGNLVRALAAAGAVALVGAVLLALLIARRLTRPLQRLEASTRDVAAGNYDRQAPVEGAREIQSLARSFNGMTRRVRSARQRQRNFLANVSHELRTPLTSIQGFSQAILEGAVTDREGYRRAAAIINEGSLRLIRLVEQLLDLDRIESRTTELVLEDVDLADLAERVAAIFEVRAREAGVAIGLRLGPVPAVLGDADRLEQVLTNLVDNAIRHSPSGATVTVSLAAEGTDSVLMTVDDEGQGIPLQDAEKVFERFQTEPDGSGAGLGLAIAREIMRIHGGDLRARNRAGGGARLTMTLGVRSAATDETATSD